MIYFLSFSADELRDMMIRIGNLCTDSFYTIGKTSACVVLYNMKEAIEKINMLLLIKIHLIFLPKSEYFICSF